MAPLFMHRPQPLYYVSPKMAGAGTGTAYSAPQLSLYTVLFARLARWYFPFKELDDGATQGLGLDFRGHNDQRTAHIYVPEARVGSKRKLYIKLFFPEELLKIGLASELYLYHTAKHQTGGVEQALCNFALSSCADISHNIPANTVCLSLELHDILCRTNIHTDTYTYRYPLNRFRWWSIFCSNHYLRDYARILPDNVQHPPLKATANLIHLSNLPHRRYPGSGG